VTNYGLKTVIVSLVIQYLTLINISPEQAEQLDFIPESCQNLFVFTSCQRVLILGLNDVPFEKVAKDQLLPENIYHGEQAYEFLIQVICGLQSKIKGENEVVSQFKLAYQEYSLSPDKNTCFMGLIEKALKDAKEIRANYLMGLNIESYASIVRKLILDQNFKPKRILITGSGQLALDLIKLLNKKYEIYISARNPERTGQLVLEYGVHAIEWQDYMLYEQFEVIVNTIGARKILFNKQFLNSWTETHTKNSSFICLGSPSPLSKKQTTSNIFRLDQVLNFGQQLQANKMSKITKAENAIKQTVKTRINNFTITHPYGWEDLFC